MFNKKEIFDDLSFLDFKKNILSDYKLAVISREMSLLGRKEVLNGHAKFGIFGDGKELPQLAMAKVFKNGDFRAGYYRDQTLMIAIKALTVRSFFSQLYGHKDEKIELSSGGRMMNSHFATRLLDDNGIWKNLIKEKNSSADISSIAGNLPRLLGLAQASKIYKILTNLKKSHKKFSLNGNEIAWGTIGNGGTSEGIFWEVINAASVLQVPMILSIWDDGYGISVPNHYQFSKKNFHSILLGFKRNIKEKGLEIMSVSGFNYCDLINTYIKAEKLARYHHIPVIIHVKDLTQPQGHSTSGSHERYKSKERIEWEKKYDGLTIFRKWILNFNLNQKNNILYIANNDQLNKIEYDAKLYVHNEQKIAWKSFITPINKLKKEALILLNNINKVHNEDEYITTEIEKLSSNLEITQRSIFSSVRKVSLYISSKTSNEKNYLIKWIHEKYYKEKIKYAKHLYGNTYNALFKVQEILPIYKKNALKVDGRIILKNNFDYLLNNYSDLLFLGEDIGLIGDVNQSLEGLQKKYGNVRISDTGIREASIIGQGIGLSMRGLKPIVEIQYIDYILYALYTMSDDLACLRYRTAGGQKAPVIIRTRGHRLEGMWHAGSPMGALINLLKGMLILVPRTMVKAAGFYNTILSSNEDPALIIECLNGYRIKETLPDNLQLIKTPIGKIEITKIGIDVTVVTYGSTWHIVTKAAKILANLNIDIEIIDIQTLQPFDIYHDIVNKSLNKTHKLVIVDEDVPGGASSYILDNILEVQNGYYQLDSKPITITAKLHKTSYGSDGDYFSKPSIEDIIEKIYFIMNEYNPNKYPINF